MSEPTNIRQGFFVLLHHEDWAKPRTCWKETRAAVAEWLSDELASETQPFIKDTTIYVVEGKEIPILLNRTGMVVTVDGAKFLVGDSDEQA